MKIDHSTKGLLHAVQGAPKPGFPLSPATASFYYTTKRLGNGSNDLRRLFVYPLPYTRFREMEEQFLNFVRVVQKLSEYVFVQKPQLVKTLGFTELDIASLVRRPPWTLFGYARLDGVKVKDGYRLFEINTRQPQMYVDADWFSNYVRERFHLDTLGVEQNARAVAEAARAHFVSCSGHQQPSGILLLPNPIHTVGRECNFLLFDRLQTVFPGVPLITGSTRELNSAAVFKDQRLYLHEQPVDLIIVQGNSGMLGSRTGLLDGRGNFMSKKVRRAYQTGKVEIFNPPSCAVTGQKRFLVLLKRQSVLDALALSEREAASLRLLPATYDEHAVPRIDHDKDNFVLKTGGGHGKGILVGSTVSQQQWERTIQEAITSKKRLTIQENIHFGTDEIIDLSTRQLTTAYVTIEPIIVNVGIAAFDPCITGFSSRAIPEGMYTQGMRFNPEKGRPEIFLGGVVETSAHD